METHQLERRRRRRPTLEGLESRSLPSTMSLFSLPAGTRPNDMVEGPDGNLWFIDLGVGIGMFDTTTQATTVFPLQGGGGGYFRGIAAGLDGNIWFTDARANAVGTINLTTHAITEFPLPTPDAIPDAITAGPDGNLWFLQLDSQIGSINATTHAISEYSVPTSAHIGSGPMEEDFTAGPDGNLWLADPDGAVQMFNLTTHELTDFPLPDSDNMLSITTGPDGDLWFTTVKHIGTINPTTDAISMFPLPLSTGWDGMSVAPNPTGITTGPDGNLWFANNFGSSIGMIDPTTDTVTEFPIVNPAPNGCCGPSPFEIVAGSSDTVWFDLSASEQVGEINLSPPNPGSTGSPVGTGSVPNPSPPNPVSTGSPVGTGSVPNLSPPNPGSTVPPSGTGSVPISVADAPPAPGLEFGFTIGLNSGSARIASRHDDTINLTLGKNRGGDSLSVANMKGLTAVSGLTLRRFDHGAGYRILAGKRAQVARPHPYRKVALPHLLATEKILTIGKGKTKHIVGFRVVLAKAFEPAIAGDMTDRLAAIPDGERSGSVGLQVSYKTSGGIGSLVLFGEAKVASTGQIVVVARS